MVSKGDISIGINVKANAQFGELTALNNELKSLATNTAGLNAVSAASSRSAAASAGRTSTTLADTRKSVQTVAAGSTALDAATTRSVKSTAALGNAARGASLEYAAMGAVGGRVFSQNEIAMRNLGMSTKSLGRAMTGVGVASVAAMAPVAYGIYKAVDNSVKLEDATYKVTAAIGATTKQQKELTKTALEWSTKGRFNAQENMGAMYELSSAGANYNDILKATPGLVSYATATQSDLTESSKLLVSALKQNGAGFDQTSRYANTFAAATNWSMATTDKLSTTLSYAGPVLSSYNNSIERQAALYSTLYDRGLDASTVGTSMRMGMIQLSKETNAHDAVLKKYGMTYDDINPSMNSMYDILTKMSKIDAFQDIGKLVGAPASTAWFTLSREANIQTTKDYEERYTGTNEAFRTANEQMKSAQGQIKILKGEMENAGYAVFEQVKPEMMEFTKFLTDQMPEISKGVGNALSGMMPGFKDVINDVKGAVDWFGKLDEGTQRMIGHMVGLAPAVAATTLVGGGALRIAGDAIYAGGMVGKVFDKIGGTRSGASSLGGMADEICRVSRCSTSAAGSVPLAASEIGLLGATGKNAGKAIKTGGLAEEIAILGLTGAATGKGGITSALARESKLAGAAEATAAKEAALLEELWIASLMGSSGAHLPGKPAEKGASSLISRLLGNSSLAGGVGLGANLGATGFILPIAATAATYGAARYGYDNNYYGMKGTGDAFGRDASGLANAAGGFINTIFNNPALKKGTRYENTASPDLVMSEQQRKANAAEFASKDFGQQIDASLKNVFDSVVQKPLQGIWDFAKASNGGDANARAVESMAKAIPVAGLAIGGGIDAVKAVQSMAAEGTRTSDAQTLAAQMKAMNISQVGGLTQNDLLSGKPDRVTQSKLDEISTTLTQTSASNKKSAEANLSVSELQRTEKVTQKGAMDLYALQMKQSEANTKLTDAIAKSDLMKAAGYGNLEYDKASQMFVSTTEKDTTGNPVAKVDLATATAIAKEDDAVASAKKSAEALEIQSIKDATKIRKDEKTSLDALTKTIDTNSDAYKESLKAATASAEAKDKAAKDGSVTSDDEIKRYATALTQKKLMDAQLQTGADEMLTRNQFGEVSAIPADAFTSIAAFMSAMSNGKFDPTKIATDDEIASANDTPSTGWFDSMNPEAKARIFANAGVTDDKNKTADKLDEILTDGIPTYAKGTFGAKNKDGETYQAGLTGENRDQYIAAADSQAKYNQLVKDGLIKAADQSTIISSKTKAQDKAFEQLANLGNALGAASERRKTALGIDDQTLNDEHAKVDNSGYYAKLNTEVPQYQLEMQKTQDAVVAGITNLPASFWKQGNIGKDFQSYLSDQKSQGKEGSVLDFLKSNQFDEIVSGAMNGEPEDIEALAKLLTPEQTTQLAGSESESMQKLDIEEIRKVTGSESQTVKTSLEEAYIKKGMGMTQGQTDKTYLRSVGDFNMGVGNLTKVVYDSTQSNIQVSKGTYDLGTHLDTLTETTSISREATKQQVADFAKTFSSPQLYNAIMSAWNDANKATTKNSDTISKSAEYASANDQISGISGTKVWGMGSDSMLIEYEKGSKQITSVIAPVGTFTKNGLETSIQTDHYKNGIYSGSTYASTGTVSDQTTMGTTIQNMAKLLSTKENPVSADSVSQLFSSDEFWNNIMAYQTVRNKSGVKTADEVEGGLSSVDASGAAINAPGATITGTTESTVGSGVNAPALSSDRKTITYTDGETIPVSIVSNDMTQTPWAASTGPDGTTMYDASKYRDTGNGDFKYVSTGLGAPGSLIQSDMSRFAGLSGASQLLSQLGIKSSSLFGGNGWNNPFTSSEMTGQNKYSTNLGYGNQQPSGENYVQVASWRGATGNGYGLASERSGVSGVDLAGPTQQVGAFTSLLADVGSTAQAATPGVQSFTKPIVELSSNYGAVGMDATTGVSGILSAVQQLQSADLSTALSGMTGISDKITSGVTDAMGAVEGSFGSFATAAAAAIEAAVPKIIPVTVQVNEVRSVSYSGGGSSGGYSSRSWAGDDD